MHKVANFISLALLLSSCNLPEAAPTDTIEPPISTSTSAPPTVIVAVPSPALTEAPLIWFAPLPPLPIVEGRRYTGSEDFMRLFKPDAPWQEAASHIHVLKLYGEWVGYTSDAQLKQAVQDAHQRGFALAMEFGPLDAEDCGEGIEGFSGVSYAVNTAKRIKAAGGTLHLLAMDEPYYFGHFYDGPNACHWSAEKIAGEIDQFVRSMRMVFPEILIGDTEPLTDPAGAKAYSDWMEIFRQVNGYDLAFLHMDIDWSRSNWAEEVIQIEEHGDQFDLPVGIIYNGNSFDVSDEDWLSAAGERVKKLELDHHANPDHVLFQSWHDKPDRVLPETEDFTFTNFINDYFADRSSLGYRREGAGANLALGKPVRVSGYISDQVGSLAVDGDLGTLWNSGGGPTQWIELDLGAEYTIGQIGLSMSQYPEGRTVHRIYGAGADHQFAELNAFDGFTKDGDVLTFLPDEPLTAIQFIRVETVTSPSWVAWREIEVIDAGN